MTLTIMSAAKEVSAMERPDMESLAKAISSGSLRGARGNSGVILSQLLRGFTKTIREEKEIDTIVLAQACERARATAYKAVMKPKEGTILTVAKGIAQKAAEMAEVTDDLEEFLPAVLAYAKEVLDQTPEMLPVLKEAGVVDSGGQGLLEVLHGAYDAFLGKEIDYSAIEASAGTKMTKAGAQAEADIKFGYCTEFIIMTDKVFTEADEMEFKSYLESIGDSIVCVADEDIVKIHVHTNHPGLAFEKGLTYGQLSRMKVDNMREEHQEKLIRDAEKLQQNRRKSASQAGWVYCSIHRRRDERDFQRTWCGLSDRRRSDDEPKYRGYAHCDRCGQCRSHLHSAKQQEHCPGSKSGKRSDKGQGYHRDSDKDSSTGNYSDHQLYAGRGRRYQHGDHAGRDQECKDRAGYVRCA